MVAVANSRDTHHEMARSEGIPDRLLVPPTVIAEVCYLLSERAGAAAEVGSCGLLRPAIWSCQS